MRLSRRGMIRAGAMISAAALVGRSAAQPFTKAEGFVCPPCGCSMDDVLFDAPGRCPDCGMVLQPQQEVSQGHLPSSLSAPAGYFTLPGRDGTRIRVDYYIPPSFTPTSKIVLVIPGSGRDSDEYRNAWLTHAWDKGALIAALQYREEDYGFSAYQLGGLVRDLSLVNMEETRPNERARVVTMRDEDIQFEPETNRDAWIFNDFDRVFEHIVKLTNSERPSYTIFGHSAGGQILHRMAIFAGENKAERIIAANAGFYTLPTLERPMPTGAQGTGLTEDDLARAFAQPLVLLLGEEDNDETAGGTLLRTPLVNEQGAGRLQRGRYFYSFGQREAEALGVPFRWQIETVPGVGHDFQGMTTAATKLV